MHIINSNSLTVAEMTDVTVFYQA